MQYSNDLRRKLVEAWNAGPETQPELADLFGVSRAGSKRCYGAGGKRATPQRWFSVMVLVRICNQPAWRT
ncbi:MAG: hypothetical protein JO028_18420 [Acidobacteriaceae bacterium]|nr:hypothetical protein [Acidobacteriaceae bacterium]